jgi:hypothetical protein
VVSAHHPLRDLLGLAKGRQQYRNEQYNHRYHNQ